MVIFYLYPPPVFLIILILENVVIWYEFTGFLAIFMEKINLLSMGMRGVVRMVPNGLSFKTTLQSSR